MNRRQCLHTIAWTSLGSCLWSSGCRSTPMTGRSQLMLIPETQEIAMGQQAFSEVLSQEKLSGNSRFQQMVERVGGRIAAASGRADYQWEFRLLSSPTQNAFCLPGGKVAVYEGILPICQNEAGLAVVMSHEVAHALARHGGERMSQETGLKTIGSVVGYAMKGRSELSRDLVLRAYGAGTQFGVVLPHSRKHELEADRIGVMLMASAGYDPSEAPKFWTRFGDAAKQANPPEWMSTHPSDSRRAAELVALLPQAQSSYDQSANRVGTGEILFG